MMLPPPLLSPFSGLVLSLLIFAKASLVSVRDGFSENFKDDLSWLITLRGAKVRNSLRDWGYINSPSCTSCPRQETIAHFFCIGPVFKECGPISFPFSLLFLAALWFAIQPLFSSFSGHVAMTRGPELRAIVSSPFCTVFGFFRNKATFHNGNEDHRLLLGSFRAMSRSVFLQISRFPNLDFLPYGSFRVSALWRMGLSKSI